MRKITFILIIIMESLLTMRLERSKKTFDQLAKEAMCTAKCHSPPGNRDECQQMCNEDRLNITILDVDAEANVRLVCRDDVQVVLEFDPGVFIAEHRKEIDGDWNSEQNALIDGQLTVNIRDPSSRYQWRLTRVFANGVSRPEITEWITTLLPGVKPKKVTKIWVRCLDQVNSAVDGQASTVRAEIAFQPSEDHCCRYRVTCRQSQGTYDRTTTVNIGEGRKTPETVFTNLESGANFTVIVEPRGSGTDGDSALMSFGTPSRWKPGGPPRICVPDEVDGLSATVIHAVQGNTFELHVTWFRPVWLPDFFIVKTTSRGASGTVYRVFHNVSGGDTETIFRGVDISQQINVSIRAWTMLGGGPDTSERLTISQKTNGPKGAN